MELYILSDNCMTTVNNVRLLISVRGDNELSPGYIVDNGCFNI